MTIRKTVSLPDEVGAVLARLSEERAKRNFERDNFSREVTERLIRTLREDGLLKDEEAGK